MECDFCHKNDLKLFPCDGCSSYNCAKCAKLTSSEIRVLELKSSRAMKFYCTKCLQFETSILLQNTIEDKNNIIASKDEIITLLKKKITDLENESLQKTPQIMSYSNAVQRNMSTSQDSIPTMQNNIPSLLIIPNNVQNSKITKQDLQQHVKPADLKVGIKNTKDMANGGVIIKCHCKQDIEKLKHEAETKLNGYQIQMSKMRKPQFKIVGYKGDLSLEEIEKYLRDQNSIINEPDMLTITFVKQNKRNQTHTIYGNCSAGLFQRLMAHKRVFLQWERYPIFENIEVQRCFKCQEYFHKSNNCPNDLRCGYCGDKHEFRECRKMEKKCINCEGANTKYGHNHPTNHEASDTNCPSYQHHIKVIRSKIDYSGVYG